MSRKRRLINPKESITNTGITVRSKSEKIVADILTDMGIFYVYERPITLDGEQYLPDFYLPQFRCYIEFWGLTSFKSYTYRMKKKKIAYRKARLRMIDVYPNSIVDRLVFRRKLLKKLRKFIE